MVRAWIFAVILLLSVAASLRSETPKTDNLVVISGVPSTERWSADDIIHLREGDSYVAFGRIACWPRTPGKDVGITVWGIGDVEFFDPTNLQGTWPVTINEISSDLDALQSQSKLLPIL